MSSEIVRWQQAGVEASLRTEGAMRSQVDKLHHLFEENHHVLGRVRDGREKFEVIEEFPFTHDSGRHRTQQGTAYFMRQANTTHILPDARCLVELKDGTKRRLLFKTDTGIVLEADSPEDECTDKSFIETLLQAASTNLTERHDAQRGKRRTFIKWSIGAAAAFLAAGGIASGVILIGQSNREDGAAKRLAAAKAAAVARKFDLTGVQLPGLFVNPSSENINFMSEADYKKVSVFKKGDDFSSPRRITINNPESCIETTVPVTATDRVAISDEYGYDDDVVAVRNNSGSLSLCRLDNTMGQWEYVVQVVGQTEQTRLKTEGLTSPHTNHITEGLYSSIPTYSEGDSLSSPRRITITAPGTCVVTTVALGANAAANLSDIYGYEDDIVTVRNSGDALSVCRLDNQNSVWEVAVQTK